MNIIFSSAIYLCLLLTPMPGLTATEIAGVKLPDQYNLGGQSLTLNGAGIRSKFFVKVYVGALYQLDKQTRAEDILATPGAKSMQMHILYETIDAKKITDGWIEGFRSNTDNIEFKKLAARLETFNKLFTDLHEGDVVYMNYTPDSGTELKINDKILGRIEGEDFYIALQKVWIGEKPADNALKKGLLGK